MSTCIVGCSRKAVSTLCACGKEVEAVDLSVVTLAAMVLKSIRAATASSGDLASSFAHKVVGCRIRNDVLAMEASCVANARIQD